MLYYRVYIHFKSFVMAPIQILFASVLYLIEQGLRSKYSKESKIIAFLFTLFHLRFWNRFEDTVLHKLVQEDVSDEQI